MCQSWWRGDVNCSLSAPTEGAGAKEGAGCMVLLRFVQMCLCVYEK